MLAVDSILEGKTYISPGISDQVMEGYMTGRKKLKKSSRWETLTQREREVLKLIAEGYKTANLKKIEVVGAGREPLLPGGGKLLGVVGVGGAGRAAAEQHGLAFIDAGDIAGVTKLVLDSFRDPTPSPSKVSIKIDGRDLDINPFVQMVVANTIRGMLGGLKGGSAAGALEVRID